MLTRNRPLCSLASYTYTNDRNNYLSSLDYGNGDKVQYEYDKKGRVTKQTYEDGATVTYQYDNNGALATITDSATGIKTSYYYDFTDRLMKYVESGTNYNHSVGYGYDLQNNLTSLVETINGTQYTTSYGYDEDNRITSVIFGNVNKNYTYDGYGRSNQQTTKNSSTTVKTDTFTFTNPTGTTSSAQIAGHAIAATGYNKNYSYTYDSNGNILSISDGTNTTSYVYDKANQLIRENNQEGRFTHVWTYDDAGNIKTRKKYNYTTESVDGITPTDSVEYKYEDERGWGDLLTSYDDQTITYDDIGNPDGIGTQTYTWKHGRQLATLTENSVTWTYTYNADGLRTKRVNNATTPTTYEYVYNGSSLTQMTKGTDTLYFSYDAAGTPMTVTWNGTVYYYVTNIQGDVIAILDSTGDDIITYTYDAWGKAISTDITDVDEKKTDAQELAQLNPIRYRGYVYDQETELYYLQSRYYDPEIGRWINTDAFPATGQGILGTNMFAYCGNNPVSRTDVGGFFWDTVLDVVSLCFSIAEVVQNPDDPMAWLGVAADVASLVIPCVSGGGALVRAATKADDVVDAFKAADNLGEVGEVIVKYGDEVKLPNQIKANDAVDAWNDFLGPNQTSYNKFTGTNEMDRIFSADGTKSIRFGGHEMRSIGTTKAHFHYENWIFDPASNTVYVENILQRLK